MENRCGTSCSCLAASYVELTGNSLHSPKSFLPHPYLSPMSLKASTTRVQSTKSVEQCPSNGGATPKQCSTFRTPVVYATGRTRIACLIRCKNVDRTHLCLITDREEILRENQEHQERYRLYNDHTSTSRKSTLNDRLGTTWA